MDTKMCVMLTESPERTAGRDAGVLARQEAGLVVPEANAARGLTGRRRRCVDG